MFYGRRMARTTKLAAVVIACALISGCLPTPTNVIPTAVPTGTPVFASEEEALAAAIEAYEAYLAVSDAILPDGGRGP